LDHDRRTDPIIQFSAEKLFGSRSIRLARITLNRLGGLAAVVAGLLRGVASLVPGNARGVLLLYFATDLFILLGSIGLYTFVREQSGLLGLIGLVLEIIGLGALMGRELSIFGNEAYPVGALVFATGLDVLAVASWKLNKIPRWILFLWIVSTIVGPIGFFSSSLGFLFVVSGLLFASSFFAAGIKVFTDQSRPRR
jgi:hypothetical protein